MSEKKKAALDSFFKSKKKQTKKSDGLDFSTGGVYDPSTSGWVEASEEAPVREVRGAGRVAVGDLTAEDMAKMGLDSSEPHIDIDADDAKKMLYGTLAAKKKHESSTASAPAPKPAASSGMTFAQAQALKREAGGGGLRAGGASGGRVDVNNKYMFPDLATAVSGLPIGAVKVEPPKDFAKFAESKNAWSVLAADDADESPEPSPTPAPAPAPVKAAPVVKASDPSSVTEADLVITGDKPIVSEASEVEELTTEVLAELKTTLLVDVAVSGLLQIRADPISLRAKSVELLFQVGLDAETKAQRKAINGVLRQLVLPSRFITAAALHAVIAEFAALYDDLLIDYPQLDTYFAELLAGLVPSVVPKEGLPAPVIKALGLTSSGASGVRFAAAGGDDDGEERGGDFSLRNRK